MGGVHCRLRRCGGSRPTGRDPPGRARLTLPGAAHDRRPTAGSARERVPGKLRVATGSTVGTTVENYDFLAYGTEVALYFGDAFFLGSSPFMAALASFATLGIGFAMRPLGGHLGDRIGRKPVLVGALLLMASRPPPSAQGAWFSELFNARVRTSGASLGYQFSAAISGFVPLIAAALAGVWGGVGVALLFVACGLIGTVTSLITREAYPRHASKSPGAEPLARPPAEPLRFRPGTGTGTGRQSGPGRFLPFRPHHQ